MGISRGLFGVAFFVAGCASEEQRAYEKLAEGGNPSFTEIRDSFARLRATAAGDHAAAIAACTSADGALGRLQQMHLELVEHGTGPHVDAKIWVDHLLNPWNRNAMCRDASPARCARWCWETWEYLAASVDELRDRARKHDVEIVSLRP